MSTIPIRVQEQLTQYQLQALEFEPGTTPTAEMAATQIGCDVGQIAKSMLFKGKDGLFRLFVCAGDRRIDNAKLKQTIGVKARMATADETLEVTGYRPGGVCPFALEGLAIYIDQSLQDYDVIYPAAGTDASGVPLTYERLQEITGAAGCDIMRAASAPEQASSQLF